MLIGRDIKRRIFVEGIDVLVIGNTGNVISQFFICFPELHYRIVPAAGQSAPGVCMKMKIGFLPMGTVHSFIGIVNFFSRKGLWNRKIIDRRCEINQQFQGQPAQENEEKDFNNFLYYKKSKIMIGCLKSK